jgi:RNA polymerase sigma factor (sigma-70 family)
MRKNFSNWRADVSFSCAMKDIIDMVIEYREGPDPERLGRIIELLRPDLFLFIYSRIPENDVEDVCHEILLEIIKGLHSFKGSKRRERYSWCFMLARAGIAKYYRKRVRIPKLDLDFDELSRLIDQNAARAHRSEMDKRDAYEALEMIRKAVPDCAELLYERYILGLQLKEMGARRGISEDAAKMRLKRCDDKLQEE